MTERTVALDKLDRAILRRLQDNGRETYDLIGEQVQLRATPNKLNIYFSDRLIASYMLAGDEEEDGAEDEE